jgi:hypothetical protein
MKFKVGDRVRIRVGGWRNQTCEIVRIDDDALYLHLPNGTTGLLFSNEVELVSGARDNAAPN